MKRTLTALFLFTALSLPAGADVQINWLTTDTGVAGPGDFPGDFILQADNSLAPAGWIAQLIFSPDAARDAVDPASPFASTGNDQVLVTQPLNGVPLDGEIQSVVPPQADSLAVPTGFVYTRVFNVTSVLDTPTLFGESGAGSDTGPLQVFNPFDPGSIAFHFPKDVVVNMAIIPEPGTWALAGFGGLLLCWRHRRKLN